LIRVALDSNILIYLSGVSRSAADDAKINRIRRLHAKLDKVITFIAPVQALGELAAVTARSGWLRTETREIVEELLRDVPSAPTMTATMASAIVLADEHRLQVWDSVIVTASVEAGCTILLSEDMQHGFAVHGLTIINPLAEPMHPKLAALL
jgi:predicted nucleic acid-binding protein